MYTRKAGHVTSKLTCLITRPLPCLLMWTVLKIMFSKTFPNTKCVVVMKQAVAVTGLHVHYSNLTGMFLLLTLPMFPVQVNRTGRKQIKLIAEISAIICVRMICTVFIYLLNNRSN